MASDRKPAEVKKRHNMLGWGEVRGQMFLLGGMTIEVALNA